MFCPATVVQAMSAMIASKRNFFIIILFDLRCKDTKKSLKNTPFSKIPSKIIHSAPLQTVSVPETAIHKDIRPVLRITMSGLPAGAYGSTYT
jgi:hypothetical protein